MTLSCWRTIGFVLVNVVCSACSPLIAPERLTSIKTIAVVTNIADTLEIHDINEGFMNTKTDSEGNKIVGDVLDLPIGHLDIDAMALNIIERHISKKFAVVMVPYNRKLLADNDASYSKRNRGFCDGFRCSMSQTDIAEAAQSLRESLPRNKRIRSESVEPNIDAYVYFFRNQTHTCRVVDNNFTVAGPFVVSYRSWISSQKLEVGVNIGMFVFDKDLQPLLDYSFTRNGGAET